MITAGLLRGGSGVTYGRRIPASFVVARRLKLFGRIGGSIILKGLGKLTGVVSTLW